ncbi:MAG: YIP1 family protein [Acidobacteriia bacterium]|nr:YIP1 family protein [Terriglobia bacterium]
MATDAVPALDSERPQMGQFSRLTGVFFDPKRTFEDIAGRPTFLIPMLVTIVSAMALIYAFNTHVGWEGYLHRLLDNNARMQQLTAEQRQQAFNLQMRIVPIGSYASAILAPAFIWLILGGIVLGIIKGLLGAPIRFAQVFAVMAYAWLPRVIFSALSIVVMYLKPPDQFDLQNSFASNPGAFMDPDKASKFLYTLASSLDIFNIWVILLMAVGLKAAGGKRLSFGGALFAVVLPWGVFVLIRGALAAAGLSN